MKKTVLRVVLLACVFTVICSGVAWAAAVTQTLTLHRGWNAVFLEVQPGLNPAPPAGCAPAADRTLPDPCEIFGGVPGILSVWAWNPRTSTVEFIQNPAQMIPRPGYMLSWFPGQPLATNLFGIAGETAYLIHRDESSPGDFALTITGEPTLPRVRWVPNSFNLVGFHLDPARLALFVDFFSGSQAHAGQEMYVLDNATASWVRVSDPSAQMRAGEAFWVFCKGSSEFQGPLEVRPESSAGLEFGDKLVEQVLVLRNNSLTERTASVTVSSAETHLHYWEPTADSPVGRWVELLAASPLPVTLGVGQERRIRLGVMRAGLEPGGSGYRANVTVSEEASAGRIILPVHAVGTDTAGLWVGDVSARQVRYNASGVPEPTPTGSSFDFRIILHVSGDETPRVRLLREVVQLWLETTWKPDPDNPGRQIVDVPGHFVLVANPTRLGEFGGVALRDGKEVGRRISSAAFVFTSPVEANAGGAFELGQALEFVIPTAADDPQNPFLHRYQKDLTAQESIRIVRDITLALNNYDGDGNPPAGVSFLSWGSTEVGGFYSETLSLKRNDANDANPYEVRLKGSFRLRRVSDVDHLEL